MKPIIKIGLIVLIIVVVGLTVYFVWSALSAPSSEFGGDTPPPQPPIAPGTGDNGSTPPAVGEPGPTQGNVIEKITENPVFDYWIDPQTNEVYYLSFDGQVFSAKKGQDIQITQQRLSAPNFIEVSPNGQRVLAAFSDPRLPQWGVFDTVDEIWRPLPDGILNAAWGENANTLIGFVKNGVSVNLSSINISQSQPAYKIILNDIRFQDVELDFSPPNDLFIKENPADGYPGKVWSINVKNLSVRTLFSPENGLTAELSRDKKTVFVFSNDAGFRILNAATLGTISPVPFSTLPSKCSPDSVVIYCFVPKGDNFKTAVLPDDYFKRKIYTSDSLFRINLATDEVSPVAIPEDASLGYIDAKNPSVSGGSIYFVNRYDDSLYSFNLGPGGE